MTCSSILYGVVWGPKRYGIVRIDEDGCFEVVKHTESSIAYASPPGRRLRDVDRHRSWMAEAVGELVKRELARGDGLVDAPVPLLSWERPGELPFPAISLGTVGSPELLDELPGSGGLGPFSPYLEVRPARLGELCVIGAPRAIGKSFLVANLAILTARGTGYLFGVLPVLSPARVLVCNGELRPRQTARRLQTLVGTSEAPAGLAQTFDRWKLRVERRKAEWRIRSE